MSANSGTLVIAAIRPSDSEDDFATAVANEIQGGIHSVANETARDAITSDRRVEGMLCYVIADDKTYQLQGGIENTDWVEYSVDLSGYVPYTGATDDLDLGTNAIIAGYDSTIGAIATDPNYFEITEKSMLEGAIKIPYLSSNVYIDELELTLRFAFFTDSIIMRETALANPRLHFADSSDNIFGYIDIDVGDTGNMAFALDAEVGSGVFTFNNDIEVSGAVISTGWGSQLGSADQYFKIEEVDLGEFGSIPMIKSYKSEGDVYDFGVFADLIGIYDNADSGGCIFGFVANDLTSTNNIALLGFDTASEKLVIGLLESDPLTVEIQGTLEITGTDPSLTLGSTELDEDTLETILATIDSVNYAYYFGDSATNNSWRIIRNGANLEFQRRESDSWVKKGEFTAS
jgi:hypothetical protein